MKDVRILHILGDSRFGGASFGILRLARYWQSVGWRVDILATDPQFLQAAAEAGVPTVPLDCIWREIRPLRDLAGLWKLYRYLRARRYTVVHTHTTKAGFAGRLAGWLARVPIVVHTAHGFAFHETSHRAKIWFYATMDRIASVGSQRVVTVSRFHKAWGEELGMAPAAKLVAIPNGIPEPPVITPEAAAAARHDLGLTERDLALFTPGRLAPEKGLEDLLDALCLARPQSPRPLKLIIAGDGSLAGPLRRQASELGIAADIRFLGFRKDIPQLLAACDVVVFPTWREGLSIALLEAMSHGKAIVTTTIGSNLEATAEGEAALLVPPRKPAELAEAILALAADESRRRSLGAAARRLYGQRYTQDRMLSGYHQLYLELLEENERARPVSTVLPSPNR